MHWKNDDLKGKTLDPLLVVASGKKQMEVLFNLLLISLISFWILILSFLLTNTHPDMRAKYPKNLLFLTWSMLPINDDL